MSRDDLNQGGIGVNSQRARDRLLERLFEKGIRNHAVLEALGSVPRHLFVDEALGYRAYEDTALPISYNQTISQPYIVARMTELLLGGRPTLDRVLEVGTGCGYQTAVLAGLVKRVYTVERILPLLEKAQQRFKSLKLLNVFSKHADGIMGWPGKGPFDGIIVTASPSEVPKELLAQLADGARLVIPVGDEGGQVLRVIQRQGDEFISTDREAVMFVPLLSGTVQ
ncbi:MAG: protein-L-isoaspartate(D-aspartate) O-methyltransferase [Gammaproteobacteria bacterium]|nr:MAG: protein-L-isoaspartate(D-aspartate) O-methyltransferase [Gammaproteobacteria bacterium]